MSKKRMMPKSVRIYYELQKKERMIRELNEYYKDLREQEYLKEMRYRGRDH